MSEGAVDPESNRRIVGYRAELDALLKRHFVALEQLAGGAAILRLTRTGDAVPGRWRVCMVGAADLQSPVAMCETGNCDPSSFVVPEELRRTLTFGGRTRVDLDDS